ncbi:unnamed protein product [Cyclocybe aegerita]|uniref:Uncharacterized protein n=1 Tax=Cyclocybe aegerita TaxID=1973307 RepID=A0A8S0X324_CYCAE|nr:unnamed protein product [Cyclocybe aegerita]
MFGGRSEHSFLKLRSLKPAFMQGIDSQVITHASDYLKDYAYLLDGPLATAVDDTKLLAFWLYFDNKKKKWFMVGGTEGPMEVADIDHLQSDIRQASSTKATKLQLWTLSIPLPHVPPLVLAASPIALKTNAKELATMEEKLLKLVISPELKLNIISLGSDGTSVEREARRKLVRSGFATTMNYQIPHPADGSAFHVELLQIGGHVMTVIQDSKHCRKTERNGLLSGAHSLILGCFLICYQDVQNISFAEGTPLYR